MFEGIAWPSWIGTPSQFAVAVMVAGSILIAYFKVWPIIRQQNIDERLKTSGNYIERISVLETQVRECEQRSDEREARLQEKVERLQTSLNNEVAQRVQSEISLVNTLIEVVDAPQLRAILKALEQKRIAATTIAQLTIVKKEPNHD